MNEAAANALYEAERTGVKQHRGDDVGPDGSVCANSVLSQAGLLPELDKSPRIERCPLCDYGLDARFSANEIGLTAHLNDDHGFTFSEIARKLGPDTA